MPEPTSSGPLTDADLAAARDLDRRFTEAMSRKDLDAAMDCFWDSPDLIVVLWGNVIRGSDALRNTLRKTFDQNTSLRLEVTEITHLPSGDGVIGFGTATYEMKPTSGPSQSIVERWSDLRRKINGRWVYVHDHASVVPE